MSFFCHTCGKELTQEEIDCQKPCSKCGTTAFIMDAEADIDIVKRGKESLLSDEEKDGLK